MSSEPEERKRVLDEAFIGLLLIGLGGGGSLVVLLLEIAPGLVVPLWVIGGTFAVAGVYGLYRLYRAVELERETDFSEVLGLE
jgi:hypothetical protein